MELEETLAQLRAALNEAMYDRDQPAVSDSMSGPND